MSDYYDNDQPYQIIVHPQKQEVIELFIKPVTRYTVERPMRFRGSEPGEPSVNKSEESVVAYWCPQLALIRLATTRYGHIDQWGPVITDAPDSAYAGTNRYKAIAMAMKAIDEAEFDLDGFIPGARTEDDAWERWSIRTPEEIERDERVDDVPF